VSRILSVLCLFLVSLLTIGCGDRIAKATAAPDLTVIVNVPPSAGKPVPPATPAVPNPEPGPLTPEPGAPDSNGATDVDDTANDPDPRELPPPDRPCDNPGKGDKVGAPGNGKGRGDEAGCHPR
jgi:hypothetical protein